MEQYGNLNTDNVQSAPMRPTFLTILCVLTFIASGWGVYKGISGYFTADATAALMVETRSKVDDQMDGKEQPAFLKNMMGSVFSSMSADNIRKSSLVSLLSCLLTLGGAIMMWTLRRTGYYVYIAGIVISIGTPMLFFPGTVGMIGSGFAAFIGLLFVGLYGMNLKDMTQ